MKIGDKVLIVENGLVGIIVDETKDGWKIDFLNGDKPMLVDKNIAMEVVEPYVNPDPKPNPRPKKRWGWKRWLWTIGIALFIGGAIALTIINVIR